MTTADPAAVIVQTRLNPGLFWPRGRGALTQGTALQLRNEPWHVRTHASKAHDCDIPILLHEIYQQENSFSGLLSLRRVRKFDAVPGADSGSKENLPIRTDCKGARTGGTERSQLE